MGHRDTIAGYFAAVNDEDWDALALLFHPEVTFQTPGAAPRRGRGDVLGLYRKLFVAWTKHHDGAGLVILEGDHAAVEVAFTGTTRDGRVIEFAAVDLFSFVCGRIASVSSWYDLGAVRRALTEVSA